ncbi:MAG: 1-phosphofructokinase [Eubacterium sp.]|nr:1-phosphofructokinase [Eubacterium sp.]
MVYTLTLNPALDYVLKVSSLKTDDINRASDAEIYYGGKGINVSVVLTRLGIENKALGFAAGFTGKELERLLEEEGINCDFIFLESGSTRINVKIKAESEIDINANGPSLAQSDVEKLFEKLDGIKEGDYLVLAGSVPENMPEDIYESIMQYLSSRGVNFIVDATGNLLKNALKFKPFLIKPNHIELGDLFGIKAESDEDIERLGKELQSLGARNVLVSRAEKGAVLIDENGEISKTENAKGTLINSVGCGDSMLAGFLAGYIENGDFKTALKLGTACGNATAYSNSLCEKNEVERLYEELEKFRH